MRKCEACEGRGYSEAMMWRAPEPPREVKIVCSCCNGTGEDNVIDLMDALRRTLGKDK